MELFRYFLAFFKAFNILLWKLIEPTLLHITTISFFFICFVHATIFFFKNKNIPNKIKDSPNVKIGDGISRKTNMPKAVAPKGSYKAIVAVSKGFRPAKEKKNKV
jgi:hypothetical protein